MKLKNIFIVLPFLLIFSSCLEKYSDFDIISDTQVIAPIAYGSFNLGDLLSNFTEDSLFQEGQEDELIFIFREDEVLEIAVSDFFRFPSDVDVVESSEVLGYIRLKDSTYHKIINLYELNERVSISDEISGFSDGERRVFPEASIGSEYSSLLTWEIEDFNFIQEADFHTGMIDFTLRNNFPANCEGEFQIFDSEMNVIQKIKFGKRPGIGLFPGESETTNFSMEGKTIKAPLYYKITALHFFESDDEVIIEMYNGFDITVHLSNMLLNNGIFNSFEYSYNSGLKQIEIPFADSIEIHKATILSGEMVFKINKGFEPSGDISVHLLNLYKNGEPFSFNIKLDSDGLISNTFDLTGCELHLSKNNLKPNFFEYYFEYSNSDNEFIKLRADDNYEYGIVLQNLKYSYVEGYFGNRVIDFSHQGFKFNQEIWDKVKGEIFGEDPLLNVFISYPSGIPIESDINMTAYNTNGQSVNLSYLNHRIEYPESIAESPKNSVLQFNHTNSNILDFIKLPPNDSIIFSVGLGMNPDGKPDSDHLNFISANDILKIGMEFRVPIVVKGSFFDYYDTLMLATGNILKNVKSAEMIFRTRNEMPMQINLILTPFDTLTKTVIGDEIFARILDAALTDDFGNVTAETVAENKLIIEGEDLDNLRKANALLLKASLMSPSDGAKPAKLKFKDGFDLKIILNVTADL